MSLFFRERRAVSYQDLWGSGADLLGRRTASRVNVTPRSALRVSSFWASVMLLANIVSGLPVDVYRGRGGRRVEVSPQPQIVASPSQIVTRRDWVFQAVVSLLSRGNAVGLATTMSAGRPTTVEWAPFDQVDIQQPNAFRPPTYTIAGVETPRDQVMHVRAFTVAGSAIGLSPVEQHAETLGLSIAGLKYGAGWFGDGAHPSGIFQNTAKTLDPKESDAVKERFLAAMRGKREPLTTGSDWKYTPVQVDPVQSALLEALGYADAQVCRLFGPGIAEVLGYATGGSLDYSTRQDRTLDLLTFTVSQWVLKLEDALTAAIPPGQYVKFNVDALLRSDPKTRWEIHQIARSIGAENVDEIRDHEDMPPLPDGQGKDWSPPGASNRDSSARLVQQLYLGVGKVISLEEARRIITASGADLDLSKTAEEIQKDLPPLPEPN